MELERCHYGPEAQVKGRGPRASTAFNNPFMQRLNSLQDRDISPLSLRLCTHSRCTLTKLNTNLFHLSWSVFLLFDSKLKSLFCMRGGSLRFESTSLPEVSNPFTLRKDAGEHLMVDCIGIL